MKALFPLILLLAACTGPGTASCALEPLGTVPVRLIGNVPVTVVGINDQPALLILDTGSDVTLLSRTAAARLGVMSERTPSLLLSGAGGRLQAARATLATLQLAGAVASGVGAVVGRKLQPPIDGVLGINVLAGLELDLDAPAGRLTVYRARGPACAGAAPPWTGPYFRLDTEQQSSGHLITPALLNGRPVHALLDTGASRTTVGLAAAAAAGITDADLRQSKPSVSQSLDAGGIVVRPQPFRELRLAGAVFPDPVLDVADLPPEAEDMIIGADYLSNRRVWIALATGTVFVDSNRPPRPR